MIITDLKLLIVDLLEMEEESKKLGNQGQLSGLQFARVLLETTLERNGVQRVSTIDVEDVPLEVEAPDFVTTN